MGVIDDRAAAFLEEVRRAVEESREEAGMEENAEETAAVLSGCWRWWREEWRRCGGLGWPTLSTR